MAILHVFNPDHDIALASDLRNFTAPHAGRQLRNDMGFFAALWIEDNAISDDFSVNASQEHLVLVDNVRQATVAWSRLRNRIGRPSCTFVDSAMLQQIHISEVKPWGWNKSLRTSLIRHGIEEKVLPSESALEQYRNLSHRRVAMALLAELQCTGTVGEAFVCDDVASVSNYLDKYGKIVVKAPWSSSGRGVHFVDRLRFSASHFQGWLNNIILQQGSVMVEPLYNKVLDFAMEFYADGRGRTEYRGLSLFHTKNGFYTGNVIATEAAKTSFLCRYVTEDSLLRVRNMIIDKLDVAPYQGPFGVDMMVCASEPGKRSEFLLHPCVEINLRRTMGHVALSLSGDDDEQRRVMRIVYDGKKYKLNIRKL